MTNALRMAVVGVGYFGRLHAEKVANLDGVRLVAVADIDVVRAAEVATEFGTEAVSDHRALFGEIDAVCVAAPTRAHYSLASDFLRHGVHVLVEKPIAHDLEAAQRLVDLARRRRMILQVGHLPRFYEETAALRSRIDCPLYIDSVRIAPFKTRGTDVNVVLDLMIHDLDLVLSLVDVPVAEVDAAGAPVFSPSEDIAMVRLKFANGCIANITASRIGMKTERKMRIFQPNAYITADFDRRTVMCFRKRGEAVYPEIPAIDVEEQQCEETDALRREIATFTASVAGRPLPVPALPPVTGEEGLQALKAALAVTDRLRAHARLVAERTGIKISR
jgi:predicted dehydrogenase